MPGARQEGFKYVYWNVSVGSVEMRADDKDKVLADLSPSNTVRLLCLAKLFH